MPAGQGKDAELFAAAVEQGTPPGSPVDGELARDLEIVAMLRSRGATFAPDPDAKARAKQRLMAVLAEQPGRPDSGRRPAPPSAQDQTAPMARVVDPAFRTAQDDVDAIAVTALMAPIVEQPEPAAGAEPDAGRGGAARPGRRTGRHTMPNRPATRAGGSRPASHGLRRRATLVGSAALVMMVALVATGVFASRDALPGDSLYALKRAAESAGLALTFDDEARARRHLELATTRLDEMERLIARSSQVPSDPALFLAALGAFDAAAGEGSRMLLASEDLARTAALDDLRLWVTDQAGRLAQLRAALPVPAADDVDGAMELLARLLGRTEALDLRSSCTEMTSGTVDDLGPLPAEGACAPRPVTPPAPDADSTGGDEDARSTSDSDDATTPGDESDDPAGSATDSPEEASTPGLLPGLGPDGSALDGRQSTGTDGSTSTTPEPGSPADGELSPPGAFPMFPPITLPPLIPGMRGITIG
jgi:hypothetical protein